jgi:hypothetical protein
MAIGFNGRSNTSIDIMPQNLRVFKEEKKKKLYCAWCSATFRRRRCKRPCTTQNYFCALKPAMKPAIMDLLSSISEFFVDQRHQLVQSLPSFFAITLISTPTASTLLVHRNHPTFDLIAVQDQQ